MERKFREAERELICQWCGFDYPVWFAPNELWNQVIKESDKLHFLCPTCFMVFAEERGVNPIAWKVEVKTYEPKSAWQHVYPINETDLHDLKTRDCHCAPRIDMENCLVVHSAVDGREFDEIAKTIEDAE